MVLWRVIPRRAAAARTGFGQGFFEVWVGMSVGSGAGGVAGRMGLRMVWRAALLGFGGFVEGMEGVEVLPDGVHGQAGAFGGGADGMAMEDAEGGNASADGAEVGALAEDEGVEGVAEAFEDDTDAATEVAGVFVAEGGDFRGGATLGVDGVEEGAFLGGKGPGAAENGVGVVASALATEVGGGCGGQAVEVEVDGDADHGGWLLDQGGTGGVAWTDGLTRAGFTFPGPETSCSFFGERTLPS